MLKGGGYRTTANLGGGFVDIKTTKPIKQNFSGFGGAKNGTSKNKSVGFSSRSHQFKRSYASRSGAGQIDVFLLLKIAFYIVGFVLVISFYVIRWFWRKVFGGPMPVTKPFYQDGGDEFDHDDVATMNQVIEVEDDDDYDQLLTDKQFSTYGVAPRIDPPRR